MFRRLRSKIILFILAGTVFAILLVALITNINVFRKYDSYLHREQEERIKQLVDMIEQTYNLNEGWTRATINNIQASPLIDNFDLVIKNTGGKILLQHSITGHGLGMHRKMMGHMGRMRMGGRHHYRPEKLDNQEDYISRSFPLQINDRNIGRAEIGYMGPFQISEENIAFSKGVNSSIFYAALVSVVLSLILGYILSKGFYDPILKITEAANKIRQGKLDTRISMKANISEYQELSQSINHLAQSLEREHRLRKRLTSDISHELRTPLTILLGHIEAINDGIWQPSQEKMNLCKNEVLRLIELVEELKYLANIEEHEISIKREKFCLSEDIMEIIENFQPTFNQLGIDLQANIQENISMVADRDKIRQILINLINNAHKFTETGDRVQVSLVEKSDTLELLVADTGVGIDSQDLPYIFERFYRSDKSRNRETGGSGIGLTIVKTLVEAHQGKISVQSRKGEGSKFTVTLPNKYS